MHGTDAREACVVCDWTEVVKVCVVSCELGLEKPEDWYNCLFTLWMERAEEPSPSPSPYAQRASSVFAVTRLVIVAADER